MANILQSTRAYLGGYGEQIIPDVLTDAETIKGAVVVWLKAHAETARVAGGTVGLGLLHLVMGMLLAILVFFRHVTHHDDPVARGSLSSALEEKVDRFSQAFAQIATAQVKISFVNTTLTAIYVFGVLRAFGVHLPFSTTIVLITFVCGLIPVVGNLISNTVIVIVSLSYSGGAALGSLVFLIVIHKLEYFLNARIVGSQINARAWELLLAMLVMESAFGMAGLIVAPIYYAYLKDELASRGLI